MAIVHGKTDTERRLLKNVPHYIKSTKDVEIVLTSLEQEYQTKYAIFEKKLPDIIEEQGGKVQILSDEITKLEKKKQEKLDKIHFSHDMEIVKVTEEDEKEIVLLESAMHNNKRAVLKLKKYYQVFPLFGNFIKRLYKIIRHKSRIKSMEMEKEKSLEAEKAKMNDLIEKKDIKRSNESKRLSQLKKKPHQVFNQDNSELTEKIRELHTIQKSEDYLGAVGEDKVLQELKKLTDSYHIFCDLQVSSPDWIMYKGKKNLRSAQLDLTVVGPSGIVIIEVKNWSDEYVRNYRGFPPHEQVDRAGLVLYHRLKSRTGSRLKISKVLLPIHNNMEYSQKYKSVYVKKLSNINHHILTRKSLITTDQISKIVSVLS